jgi:hypothetical protein
MLDHAAQHRYLSLKMVHHLIEPTRYEFDFRQSSFLETRTERDLIALFAEPAVGADYLTAMQALGEYRLTQALRKCRERGQRLIIYEDGGYIVTKVHEIYRNPAHPAHALVKTAVDEGLIVGVVEVTVAGERKNLQLIQENNGPALLPVLSNARSDIKAVFEALGVAEAVVQASATSLGRLGLPTFQTRRVAIIGGNGAIGTRLVEQFTKLHNSAANVFAVDITDRPFVLELDSQALPHAATRLKYHPLPRFLVGDTCLPIILDAPYSARVVQPQWRAIAQAIVAFLREDSSYQELALVGGFPLPEAELTRLWQLVASETGWRFTSQTPLPNGAGTRCGIRRDGAEKTVTLLANFTVLTFRNVSRLIRSGVNTIVGSTGYPIFSAKDLDEFLARPNPPGSVDELVLISASSKDYEFRRAIDFLNVLLKLQSRAVVPAEQGLAWFADFYKDGLHFLQGADFAPMRKLLASTVSAEPLAAFVAEAPDVARAAGLSQDRSVNGRELLAEFIAERIRHCVSIHKEIRSDIGSIYHVVVNGQAKRVVLLADGLVVNFFARHEKGVKTEFIDPVVTMQLLSLIKLSATAITPGLYKMDTQLRAEDLAVFWAAIDDKCRPLALKR